MLFILWYFIFIPTGTPATLKPKSVNLALETVLEFDKKSLASDVKIIDSVQSFLTKVRNALDESKSKVSRRSLGGGGDRMKFIDFVENTLIVLRTYTDAELEDLVKNMDKELRKYHYKGCKFYELLENFSFRMYIADSLYQLTNVSGRKLRHAIDYILIKMKDRSFDRKEIEFIEYVNSLYPSDSTQNMFEFLNSLQNYKTDTKRSENDLQTLVKNGIRSLLFDHYTKLNNNARKDLKFKINTYFVDHSPRDKNVIKSKNMADDIVIQKGKAPFRIPYTLGDFNNSPRTTLAEYTPNEIPIKEININIGPEHLLSFFTEAFSTKTKPKTKHEKHKKKKDKEKKVEKVEKVKKEKKLKHSDTSSTELTTNPYKTLTLWVEPRKKKRGSKYEKEFKKNVSEATSTTKKKKPKHIHLIGSSEKKKKHKQPKDIQLKELKIEKLHHRLTTKKVGPQQSEEMEQIQQMYMKITEDSDVIKPVEITEPTTRVTKEKRKKKKGRKSKEVERETTTRHSKKHKKKSKKSEHSREVLREIADIANDSDKTRKIFRAETIEGDDGMTIESFEKNNPEGHYIFRKQFQQGSKQKKNFIKKKHLQRKQVTPMADSVEDIKQYTVINKNDRVGSNDSFLIHKINNLEKELANVKRRMENNTINNITTAKTTEIMPSTTSYWKTSDMTTKIVETVVTRTTEERTTMENFETTQKATIFTEQTIKPTATTKVTSVVKTNFKNNDNPREYFIPKVKHPNETVVKLLKPVVNYETETAEKPKEFKNVSKKGDKNEKKPYLKSQLKTILSEWPNKSDNVHKINLVKQAGVGDVDIVLTRQNNTVAPQNKLENNTTAKNQETIKTDKNILENGTQTTNAANVDQQSGRVIDFFNSVPAKRFIR